MCARAKILPRKKKQKWLKIFILSYFFFIKYAYTSIIHNYVEIVITIKNKKRGEIHLNSFFLSLIKTAGTSHLRRHDSPSSRRLRHDCLVDRRACPVQTSYSGAINSLYPVSVGWGTSDAIDAFYVRE